jgi:cytochrome c oxidase cbb3-type subunit III
MKSIAIIVIALCACRQERYLEERGIAPKGGERIAIQTSPLAAGRGVPTRDVANPYEGNVHAVQEGKQFYIWFNCAGCHGAIGGGAIGPPLRDRDWIYGSSSAQIYHSIVEGRPQGMPAYRGVPEESLWKLVAFVRSLGEHPTEEPGAVATEPEKLQRETQSKEAPHGAK